MMVRAEAFKSLADAKIINNSDVLSIKFWVNNKNLDFIVTKVIMQGK